MEYMYAINSDGELCHWGIKGMKWGIRRYQNKDGSLTPAGKKRYDDDGDDNTPKRKSAKDMSDEELDRAIIRARKEDEYNRLRPEPTKKPSVMKQLVDTVVAPAVLSSGKKALEKALDKAVETALKDKVDPDSMEALKKAYDKLKLKVDIDKLQNPDKYLSWEDRTKKYNLERTQQANAEADAIKKAAAQKEAADKKAKQDADRRAYEEYNRPYTEEPSATSSTSSYRPSKPGGREQVNPNENSNVSSGQKYLTGYDNWDSSYSSTAKSSTTSNGSKTCYSIIDKYGNEIILEEY